MEIINLFKNFNKYSKTSVKELKDYLQPCLQLNQYKTFYKNNKIVGFVLWAYLHDLVQKRFKKSGKIKANEWNSGKNVWIVDILCLENTKQIMSWVINYFKEILTVDQSVNWIRLKNYNVYRYGYKSKREFHI